MLSTDKGVRLCIGVSDSGKTHSIRHDVFEAGQQFPVVVIDRTFEWDGIAGVPEHRIAGTRNVDKVPKLVERGVRIIIVRCALKDVPAVADDVCAWAKEHKGRAGVACPEAQAVIPSGGSMSENVADVVLAYRHFDVASWWDSQRLALVDASVRAQADEQRLFTMWETVDLERARKSVRDGDELVKQLDFCAEQFVLWKRTKDPKHAGWHVRLGPVRKPPYTPVRT